MKIVVLDGYTLNPGDLSWDRLAALGDLTVYDRTAAHQLLSRVSEADILFTNKTPISAETLKSLPTVKYIGVLATGYNVVEVAAARDLGITVTNIPSYGTRSVAQMVFAHLLGICHHVGAHNEAVKQGAWGRSGDWCFWNHPLMELDGKTMGIVGLGRIGRTVAQIAKSFGMLVVATDPSSPESEPHPDSHLVGLNELLHRADIITLHCPLTPETENLINRQTIARMKPGVILINTSRGPLINEADLAEGLKSGRIAAAGLDVLRTEPPADDHPLLSIPNCYLTPHIAWAPIEARTRLMNMAVTNLEAFLGGNPVNVVN